MLQRISFRTRTCFGRQKSILLAKRDKDINYEVTSAAKKAAQMKLPSSRVRLREVLFS